MTNGTYCEVNDYINLIVLQGTIEDISHASRLDGEKVCTFVLDTGESAVNAHAGYLSDRTNHIRCKIVGEGAHAAFRELRNGQLYHCNGRLVQVNYKNEYTGRSGYRHEVIVFRGTVLTPPIAERNEKSAETVVVEDLIPFTRGKEGTDA